MQNEKVALLEGIAGEHLDWPPKSTPVESPYQLRPRTRRTEFSNSVVRMVKAFSVIKLESEDSTPDLQVEQEIQMEQPQPNTVIVLEVIRNDPLKW